MQKYLFTALLFVLPFFVGAQDVKDLIKAGIQLHDAGDFKGAIAKYEEALKLDAKSPNALFEIANTYVALEEYKKALKYVEKGLDLKSGIQGDFYMLKGTALDMMEKPKDAIKAYQEGIKAEPDMQLLYFNLGVTYGRQQQFKEAEAMLIESIKRKPSHPGSHYVLGQIAFARNQKTKALMAYENFLLLENKTERAITAADRVYKILEPEKNETGGFNINITMNKDDIDDISMADMMIGMFAIVKKGIAKSQKDSAKVVSYSMDSLQAEVDTVQTKAAGFAEQNGNILKYFGEAKEKHKSFWWTYYGDFYGQLAKAGHAETFSYYISKPRKDKNITEWLKKNGAKIESFAGWLKAYEFNTK